MRIDMAITINDEEVDVEIELETWPDQKGGLYVEPIAAGFDIEYVWLAGSEVEVDPLNDRQIDQIGRAVLEMMQPEA